MRKSMIVGIVMSFSAVVACYSENLVAVNGYWEEDVGDMWGVTYTGQDFFIAASAGSLLLTTLVTLSDSAVNAQLATQYGAGWSNLSSSQFAYDLAVGYFFSGFLYAGAGLTGAHVHISAGTSTAGFATDLNLGSATVFGGVMTKDNPGIFFDARAGYRFGFDPTGQVTVNYNGTTYQSSLTSYSSLINFLRGFFLQLGIGYSFSTG